MKKAEEVSRKRSRNSHGRCVYRGPYRNRTVLASLFQTAQSGQAKKSKNRALTFTVYVLSLLPICICFLQGRPKVLNFRKSRIFFLNYIQISAVFRVYSGQLKWLGVGLVMCLGSSKARIRNRLEYGIGYG